MSDTNQLPTPPAERPTPITDAATFVIPCHGADGTGSRVAVVHFQVASDLERQLSEVRESGQRKVTEMAHRIAQLEYDLREATKAREDYFAAWTTARKKATEAWALAHDAAIELRELREQRDKAREKLLNNENEEASLCPEDQSWQETLKAAREQRDRLAESFREWPRLRDWLEMDPFIRGYMSAEIESFDAISAAVERSENESR